MKPVLEYCKEGIAERVLFLSPVALMILCDVIQWCETYKMPCVISDAVSTLDEDERLKRVSSTHREGRAFDVSTRGWGELQIKAIQQEFMHKYAGYAAIGKSGQPTLVYHHDAGTGPHLHFQVAKRFSMPLISDIT